jgi:hypothetical protein
MRSELGRISERRKWYMSNYVQLSRIVRIKGVPCLVINKFPKEKYEHFSSHETLRFILLQYDTASPAK